MVTNKEITIFKYHVNTTETHRKRKHFHCCLDNFSMYSYACKYINVRKDYK